MDPYYAAIFAKHALDVIGGWGHALVHVRVYGDPGGSGAPNWLHRALDTGGVVD